MAIVPTITSVNEKLRPNLRQGIDVQANANDFGAAVGRGLTDLAGGINSFAKSMQAVAAREDEARVKEADSAYANDVRDLMYNPDTGYMMQGGKNAVDGYKSFSEKLEELRKERGKGLTGQSAQLYDDVTRRRADGVKQTGTIHAGSEKKNWIKNTAKARADTFMEDAVAGYDQPGTVEKSIVGGLSEIKSLAEDEGWDEDTLKNASAEYASKVRRAVVGRMGDADPLKAHEYFLKHKDKFTGTDQVAIEGVLREGVTTERAKQNVERLLGAKRKPPPVNNGGADPGKPTLSNTGNIVPKVYLKGKTNKDASHIDNLDDNFAANLVAMIEDAPPAIRDGLQVMSGYRSEDRQRELFRNAVRKYGSVDAARKWVAPPGKSRHNHGQAVDLMFNGARLDKAPKEVVAWVHRNAEKYGLNFPLGHEAWHIEPQGARGRGSLVVARDGKLSARAEMPSYAEIESQVENITDPEERRKTLTLLKASMESQEREQKAQSTALKQSVFELVEQGGSPDDAPLEVRLAIGQEGLSSLWSYHEAKIKRGEPETDQERLYFLRRFAAEEPEEFGRLNMVDYRHMLDDQAFKEMGELQNGIITKNRQAIHTGSAYADIYKQADQQLESLGLVTTGLTGDKNRDERLAMSKRIARFQNEIRNEVDAFAVKNKRLPSFAESQMMINRMLVQGVVQKGGSWFSSGEEPMFAFEAGQLAAGEAWKPQIEYQDIPMDMRKALAADLENKLGEPPTQEEITQEYLDFILGRPSKYQARPAFDPTALVPQGNRDWQRDDGAELQPVEESEEFPALDVVAPFGAATGAFKALEDQAQ